MKNEKHHTVGIMPKSNIKIKQRGKIDTHTIYDHSLSWLGTGTSIKSGGFKLDFNCCEMVIPNVNINGANNNRDILRKIPC